MTTFYIFPRKSAPWLGCFFIFFGHNQALSHMKIQYHCFLLLCAILLLSRCQAPVQEAATTPSHGFAELEADFSAPPIEYSTAPLWVWNDEVTKAKIDRDLQAFKEQQILQVFVHPRPGLITNYLSEEWFELWQYTLQKGEAMGMNIWIYDENSFPSGFGGGHVQAEMPESYNQGMALAVRELPVGKPIPFSHYEYVLQTQADGSFVVVTDTTTVQIPSQAGAFMGVEKLKAPLNGFFGGFSYVDLLVPGVTEKFIEVTMPGYEQIAGAEFGKRVPGIFTDEPNISPRAAEKGVIRWTPSLFQDFEKRWGYDLRPHVPSLFKEVGNWKQVRHNYYELLLELFIERWSKPWYEYTEAKGLQWTGHYWEHGWPSPHHGGDNMAMYAWHQIPGIDMLFNNFALSPNQFGNARAVKELASVANQLGRERALSETYGAAGWDLSFEEMKRLGDWEYALGVNFMDQHLSYMTLKGRRKGDFPQSLSYHAPYWEDYGALAAYFHRLSFALTRGEQRHQTLILEPTTTAWMYYSPTESNPDFEDIEPAFRALLDTLEMRQLGYDLASENILKDHGSIANELFVVGERQYKTLILPKGLENLDRYTWQLLRDFTQNGGKLVLMGQPPTLLDGAESDSLRQFFTEQRENVLRASQENDAQLLALLETEAFTPLNPSQWGGQVHHMRRQLADGQLLFFTNFDSTETAKVAFQAKGEAVTVFNPMDGSIKPFPAEREGDRVHVAAGNLPPAGSLLLFVHDEAQQGEAPITLDKGAGQPISAATKVQRLTPNSLTLDYLDLKVGDQTFENLYFSYAADTAYKHNGLEPYGRSGYNPWAVAVQYKTNILDMGEKFDENSGFVADYHFTVAEGFTPNELKAVVEWAQLYEISINGQSVAPTPEAWWLDESFLVLDLAEHVQPGRNTLQLSVQPMHIHAEIEPVYLIGDFDLVSAAQGFTIVPPSPKKLGAWKAQGLPMYSGSVAYTKTFSATAGMGYQVTLGEWNGTVARVKVNGEKVGIIAWQPYQLDISQWILDGENEVTVEVVGSLQNLLGQHHNNIRPGIVTPWSWFFAPDGQPAGEQYHLLEYGLFEDFEVRQSAAPL